MTLVPATLVRDHWFRTLADMSCGTLEFVGPDGNVTTQNGRLPGPSVRFQVHDWSVLQRAAARGDIGLGEDYIAGGWDTDDVEALITYFLLNFDRARRLRERQFPQPASVRAAATRWFAATA